MASQVEIYNLALGSIGQSDTVASPTERSKAAQVCTRFWDLARDTVLAEFPWPFATRYEALASLPGIAPNWSYQYQYPNDCLRALYVFNEGYRNPPASLQPNFQMGYGSAGQIVLADVPRARLAYVARVEDTGRFPPLFVNVLAWKLAAMIAMPLTNTRTITETAETIYRQAAQEAWAQALNESRTDQVRESEFIAVRGAGRAECLPWGAF